MDVPREENGSARARLWEGVAAPLSAGKAHGRSPPSACHVSGAGFTPHPPRDLAQLRGSTALGGPTDGEGGAWALRHGRRSGWGAAERFKVALRRRRYDWGWQATALHAALHHVFDLLPLSTPFFGLLAEPEPGFMSATLTPVANWRFR